MVIFVVEDNCYGISMNIDCFNLFKFGIFDEGFGIVDVDVCYFDCVFDVVVVVIGKVCLGEGFILMVCELDCFCSYMSSDDYCVYCVLDEIFEMMECDLISVLVSEFMELGDFVLEDWELI